MLEEDVKFVSGISWLTVVRSRFLLEEAKSLLRREFLDYMTARNVITKTVGHGFS